MFSTLISQSFCRCEASKIKIIQLRTEHQNRKDYHLEKSGLPLLKKKNNTFPREVSVLKDTMRRLEEIIHIHRKRTCCFGK